jgi:hypothetical protein
VAERLTADQKRDGSIPSVPFCSLHGDSKKKKELKLFETEIDGRDHEIAAGVVKAIEPCCVMRGRLATEEFALIGCRIAKKTCNKQAKSSEKTKF